jgi:hypothetical protein
VGCDLVAAVWLLEVVAVGLVAVLLAEVLDGLLLPTLLLVALLLPPVLAKVLAFVRTELPVPALEVCAVLVEAVDPDGEVALVLVLAEVLVASALLLLVLLLPLVPLVPLVLAPLPVVAAALVPPEAALAVVP